MKKQAKYLSGAYVLMVLVIFILPFFSFESYTIFGNTTSHLGAQGAPNAWIMNLTFIALGLGTILSGWKYFGNYWFHKVVMLVFAGSLILAAFFRHAPIEPEFAINIQEDSLHSAFATATGFSFTILAVASAFILRYPTDKVLAVFMGIWATVFSLLMFNHEPLMGLWQRFIFIGCFGWLIYMFGRPAKLKRFY